ncbi:protein kinase [Streptomyces sp. NPDC018833]|uniref:serine/threonine-protein kinase n=1 Tax=Streptomyces sp. NPDC018833 TaxID=3365053 RepID=UPI0037B5519E
MRPLEPEDPRGVAGYRLLARVGEGGMGAVYLSTTRGNQPIALKVIRREYAEDDAFRRRFEQEARAARSVHGYHIVPVVDHDTTGPRPWLATTYVPGLPLDVVIADHGPLPLPAVLQLMGCAAEALRSVHAAGVIHRDLKPSNVLLGSDGPWIIDFGIAKAADATQLTRSGGLIGTPQFMSPEHANGLSLTPATDIFSLGLIAAVTATGRHPYGDSGAITLATQIANTQLRPPDLSGYPQPLRTLLERCLAAEPAARPAPAELTALCEEMGDRALRDFTGWLPAAVAAGIAEREKQLSAALIGTTEPGPERNGAGIGAAASAPPGVADDTVPPAPGYAPAFTGGHDTVPPAPGHNPHRPPSRPAGPPIPSAPAVAPTPKTDPPSGGSPAAATGRRTRKPLLIGAALAAAAAVVAAVWAFLPNDESGTEGKEGGRAPDNSAQRTPSAGESSQDGAERTGTSGPEEPTYEVVFAKKPFAMRYPATGYTDLDLDLPKAVPSRTDSSGSEWIFKQPGLLATPYGMVIRSPTGISAGRTPEECRTAVDANALPGELNDKQMNDAFAKGSVLCTVTEKGSLAMMEITDVQENDGAPDLFGEVTLWKMS